MPFLQLAVVCHQFSWIVVHGSGYFVPCFPTVDNRQDVEALLTHDGFGLFLGRLTLCNARPSRFTETEYCSININDALSQKMCVFVKRDCHKLFLSQHLWHLDIMTSNG